MERLPWLEGIPIILSTNLHPEDVFIVPNTTSTLHSKVLIVGSLVAEYLKREKEPTTMGWCWFKAKHYGYGRPKVSIA